MHDKAEHQIFDRKIDSGRQNSFRALHRIGRAATIVSHEGKPMEIRMQFRTFLFTEKIVLGTT